MHMVKMKKKEKKHKQYNFEYFLFCFHVSLFMWKINAVLLIRLAFSKIFLLFLFLLTGKIQLYRFFSWEHLGKYKSLSYTIYKHVNIHNSFHLFLLTFIVRNIILITRSCQTPKTLEIIVFRKK